MEITYLRITKKPFFLTMKNGLKYIFEISKHATITHIAFICFV